jgi:hypothetical protein
MPLYHSLPYAHGGTQRGERGRSNDVAVSRGAQSANGNRLLVDASPYRCWPVSVAEGK